MDKTFKVFNQPWRFFFIALGILVTLMFILLGILLVYFPSQIKFDPQAIVVEYAKFLGGIFSMLFGFYLVNVVWDRRIKAYQAGRSKKILAHFLRRINLLCRQMKDQLAMNFYPEEIEQSGKRDGRIQEVMLKLRSLGEGIEHYAPEVELIDDEDTRDAVVAVWADVRTQIDCLPVGKDFRVDLGEFKKMIETLIQSTEEGMSRLRS